MHAAIVITNNEGMSQPKTIPTCPPESSGNIKVDETDAITPIMEKAKQMVSISYHLNIL